MHRCLGIFCFLIVSGLIAGCTAPPQKAASAVAVKGKITLDGQPMAAGEIMFSTPGFPANIMEIKDGTFSGKASVGKNLVEVVRMKEEGFTTTEPKMPIKINTIDDKFNGPKSTLSAEVTKDGKNEFDFQVTSKK
ncbi:MAG TPA: hypothetical protein VFE62_06245 [Gemmataceae bacterium]|nr:hypothetical protein [Gemmataceae bacterium]